MSGSMADPPPQGERSRRYILDFARAQGLESKEDAAHNVYVRKPASKGMEDRKGVILQAHLDMVPQKNNDKEFDFTKDPIDAYIDGGWATADGTKDNDELTVRITGGGQFADGTTEKTVRVGHLDPTAAELPTAMWKNSQQEFIIFSRPKNPFTSNTRMELMAGKYEMESGNTRIFIDNLYVLRLKWYDFEDLFGKLPWVQNAPRH